MANSVNMKKYKIIGNFGPHGTKVIDTETGEAIQVRAVYWMHECGSAPKCLIEIVGAVLEGDGELIDASIMDSGLYRKWKRFTGTRKPRLRDFYNFWIKGLCKCLKDCATHV